MSRKIYIREENINLLQEGRDRKQQARHKTKQIIRDYFKGWNVDEPTEDTNGMPLVDFLEQECIHEFFHSRERQDPKGYFITLEPIVMRILLSCGWEQDRNDHGVINSLQEILNYIESASKQGKLDIRTIPLDSSIDALLDAYGGAIEEMKREEEGVLTNMQFTENKEYTILDDVDYETAHDIGKDSFTNLPLCYTQNKDTWDNFKNEGKNKVYVILKQGYLYIKEMHGENLLPQYPNASAYDEYGLSMIFVFVSPEGNIAYCNTRWNHAADYGKGMSTDHALSKIDISQIVGINFNERFKGYTVEELNAKGIKYIAFDMVEAMLAQGVSPYKIFDGVDGVYDGKAAVVLNGKYNYLTSEHQLLLNKWVDNAHEFHNGYAMVELNEKWNFIDENGDFTLPQWYDYLEDFNEGLAQVELDRKWNFIDKGGNILSQQWFDGVNDFREGVAIVKMGDKENFIDKKGNLLSKQWFWSAYNFNNGFAEVDLDGKSNFINANGDIVSKQWFDDVYDFSDGLAVVEINGECNFLKPNGELLSKEWFDYSNRFENGWAFVESNGLQTYINKEGQFASNQWFDTVDKFINGFAKVFLKSKYNFINLNGQLISRQWFDYAMSFNNGFGIVTMGDKTYRINAEGQLFDITIPRTTKVESKMNKGKKIYINENALKDIVNTRLLPQFLYKLVKNHNTPLGDSVVFPTSGDYPFDYLLLKERFIFVSEEIEALNLESLDEDYLISRLSSLVKECRELERPFRDTLEKICENSLNELFAIPKESINMTFKIVDKIKYKGAIRLRPESDDKITYSFKDVEDIDFINKEVAKRRFIDSLIQGIAYVYSRIEGLYIDEIDKINPKLPRLYREIDIINNYLLFIKEEEMTDEKPMQGSYVETRLGIDDEKTSIDVQGLTFPLLLQESIKGLFELFSTHGLPKDRKQAQYVIKKADFALAEPFDLRFGVNLYGLVFGDIKDTKVFPYVFTDYVSLPTDEFNVITKEILSNTEKGQTFMGELKANAEYDRGYQEFSDRVSKKNTDKSIIQDSYFSGAETSGYEVDSDDEGGDVIEEDD